jgi:hypothetical protein
MPKAPPEPPPPTPLKTVLAVIIIVNVVVLFFLGQRGMLQRLPEWQQFYFGVATFGFPVLVYFLLRRRRERGE